jgi:hypothetical protein
MWCGAVIKQLEQRKQAPDVRPTSSSFFEELVTYIMDCNGNSMECSSGIKVERSNHADYGQLMIHQSNQSYLIQSTVYLRHFVTAEGIEFKHLLFIYAILLQLKALNLNILIVIFVNFIHRLGSIWNSFAKFIL